MKALKIEILNPKAYKLLKDLADLNLISIGEVEKKTSLQTVLKKLRSNSDIAPSLSEITKEIDLVRSKRHAKNA